MPLDLDGDLRAMMADFGVALAFGAYTSTGLLGIATVEDTLESGSSIIAGTSRVVTFPAETLPGLKIGSGLTVAGVVYPVKDFKLVGDGRVAKAFLGAIS